MEKSSKQPKPRRHQWPGERSAADTMKEILKRRLALEESQPCAGDTPSALKEFRAPQQVDEYAYLE